MSKIDELINKYCPNGVEFKKIDDSCLIHNNKRKPVKSSLRISGQTPYYGANNIQDYVDGFTHDGDCVLIAEDGSASLESYSIQYARGKFWANNHVHVISGGDDLSSRFLFHYLKNLNFRPFLSGGDRAKLTKAKMIAITIPTPPLPVQQEIVKILDTFTELEAELEAELESRKKQYQYYQDELLGFSKDLEKHPLETLIKAYCPNGVEFVALKTLLDYAQPTKYIVNSTKYHNDHSIPVLTAGDSFILGYTNEKIGVYSASNNKPVIIFDDFTTSFHWVDFPFKIKSSAMKILTPKKDVNFKYVYYAMKNIRYKPTNHSRQWISVYSNFEIPNPPISIQQEIVNILDKFDALVNDLSSGLPAEIKARRQQYEYYRNKLLTFKELSV